MIFVRLMYSSKHYLDRVASAILRGLKGTGNSGKIGETSVLCPKLSKQASTVVS